MSDYLLISSSFVYILHRLKNSFVFGIVSWRPTFVLVVCDLACNILHLIEQWHEHHSLQNPAPTIHSLSRAGITFFFHSHERVTHPWGKKDYFPFLRCQTSSCPSQRARFILSWGMLLSSHAMLQNSLLLNYQLF